MSERDSTSPHYFTFQGIPKKDFFSQVIDLRLGTAVLKMASGEGVFSRGKLDSGSQLLIETLTQHLDENETVVSLSGVEDGKCIPTERCFDSAQHDKSPSSHKEQATTFRICDLGCGWGAVGSFLSLKFPQAEISFCDANLRAVWLTKHNLGTNNLPDSRLWCGDGLGAVRTEYFDAVVCNPPIRAGNETIARLFDESHRCLKSGGTLWIVIRTAQGAKSWQKRLSTFFGNCETLAIRSGYRVLKSIK